MEHLKALDAVQARVDEMMAEKWAEEAQARTRADEAQAEAALAEDLRMRGMGAPHR